MGDPRSPPARAQAGAAQAPLGKGRKWAAGPGREIMAAGLPKSLHCHPWHNDDLPSSAQRPAKSTYKAGSGSPFKGCSFPREGVSGLCLDPEEGQLSCPGDASALGPGRTRLLGGEGPWMPCTAWGRPSGQSLERALHPNLTPRGHRLSIASLASSQTHREVERFILMTEGGQDPGEGRTCSEARDKGEESSPCPARPPHLHVSHFSAWASFDHSVNIH